MSLVFAESLRGLVSSKADILTGIASKLPMARSKQIKAHPSVSSYRSVGTNLCCMLASSDYVKRGNLPFGLSSVQQLNNTISEKETIVKGSLHHVGSYRFPQQTSTQHGVSLGLHEVRVLRLSKDDIPLFGERIRPGLASEQNVPLHQELLVFVVLGAGGNNFSEHQR